MTDSRFETTCTLLGIVIALIVILVLSLRGCDQYQERQLRCIQEHGIMTNNGCSFSGGR
jgi:hypothetical protein